MIDRSNFGRRTRALLTILLGGGILAWAGSANAYVPTKRISIAGQLGLSGYSMADVNREIRRGNDFMAENNYVPLEEIHRGFNFQADLRCGIRGPYGVSLGIGRTRGSSGVDFDQVIEIKPAGNYFTARMSYMLPLRPRPSIRMFAEAGPMYLASGRSEVVHERRDSDIGILRIETLGMEAKGFGGEAKLVGEVVFNERVTLWSDVGYRRLSIEPDAPSLSITRVRDPGLDANHNGIPDAQELVEGSYLLNAFLDGEQALPSGMTVDFSGVSANVGLRFYLF